MPVFDEPFFQILHAEPHYILPRAYPFFLFTPHTAGVVTFKNPVGSDVVLNTPNNGLRASWIAKIAPDGDVKWAKFYMPNNGNSQAFGVSVDAANNIYLA